jgi:hypothetical protein
MPPLRVHSPQGHLHAAISPERIDQPDLRTAGEHRIAQRAGAATRTATIIHRRAAHPAARRPLAAVQQRRRRPHVTFVDLLA